MKQIVFLFSVLFFKQGFGQTVSAAPANSMTQTASVIVHKDPRIDILIKKKAAINKTAKTSVYRTGRGYRLLIISTNNRNEAVDAKTKIYNFFPELKAYLSYQSPYFKLKAGDFKTRDEAERYRKNMNSIFPKGVYITNDTIEIKPEKEKEGEDN